MNLNFFHRLGDRLAAAMGGQANRPLKVTAAADLPDRIEIPKFKRSKKQRAAARRRGKRS